MGHLERDLLHAVHPALQPRHDGSLKLIVLQANKAESRLPVSHPFTKWQHRRRFSAEIAVSGLRSAGTNL